MAPSNRDQTTALMACLAATPEDFDFFRAVSLLQAAHPMAPRIGCAESPSDEYVRFGQLPSLSFPSRSLEKFVPGNPARLYVNFFGFFGPSGALPLWATQHAMVCQDLVRRREVEPGGVGESDMPDPSALARFLLRMDVPLAAWLRTRLDAPFLTYLEMVNPARFREDEPRQRLVMAINTVLSDPSFETEGVRMGVLGSVDSADATMREPLHAQLALRSRNRQLFRKAINKAANCEVIVVPDPRAGTDSSFVEFLNLIQHRFYALFYRAWAVHQLEPASFHAETPFAQRHPALRILASLAGFGSPSLWTREGSDPDELFRYLGLLPARARSAAMLQSLLTDCLGVPVAIQQFIGRWIRLPEVDLARLDDGSPQSALGEGAILGDEVFSGDMAFRVEVGPLDLECYGQFLPGRPGFRKLHRWVELMVNRELAWDLRLILRHDQIPPCRFPEEDGSPSLASPALGWSSWLQDDSRTLDASDFLHDPESEGLGLPSPS